MCVEVQGQLVGVAGAQVLRLGSECLYLLSHLTRPEYVACFNCSYL
ncbi:rCG25461 [Rattus norvegicus]|uniref:RCG25461 n=1 Tax=Rattus norvegicus TaxID=10116 RepID=A6I462_RAT|nr:rCG25461 [Rattus norvegicus]